MRARAWVAHDSLRHTGGTNRVAYSPSGILDVIRGTVDSSDIVPQAGEGHATEVAPPR